MTPLRRAAAAAAGLLLAGALAACGTAASAPAAGGSAVEVAPPVGSRTSAPRPAGSGDVDAATPVAPATDAAWLAQVGHIYGDSGTHGASAMQWLRDRAANRRPGERLAVVMGIDDVMLQTHFAGLGSPVPASTAFVRAAHRLGYAVFYVTGRPDGSTGLAQAAAALRHAAVPIAGVCGRPPGDTEAQGKAACRAAIESHGFTIAMEVAASEASFDGRPAAEAAVHLPSFGGPAV